MIAKTKRPLEADVRFFATPDKWRRWLEKNHARATEVWVGFHRKGSGTPSITWPEAVDEALCFGWIDGIRKSIDETRYTNRFTPRKKGSNWVMSAKQEATRERRLASLIADSAAGRRVGPLRRPDE